MLLRLLLHLLLILRATALAPSLRHKLLARRLLLLRLLRLLRLLLLLLRLPLQLCRSSARLLRLALHCVL